VEPTPRFALGRKCSFQDLHGDAKHQLIGVVSHFSEAVHPRAPNVLSSAAPLGTWPSLQETHQWIGNSKPLPAGSAAANGYAPLNRLYYASQDVDALTAVNFTLVTLP
jgi:hypothetical protein